MRNKMIKRIFHSVLMLQWITTILPAELIQPNFKTCIENGGEVKYGTMCYSNFESTVAICAKSGAWMPTIDEFKGVIDACGGDAERIYLQKKDAEYEACLVRKGFPIKQLYWTSSPLENVDQKGHLIHLTLGAFQAKKSYKKGAVYCVQDE